MTGWCDGAALLSGPEGFYSSYNAAKEQRHTSDPFIVTFDVVERPRNKYVPVIAHVIAAINGRSSTKLPFILSLEFIRQKTHRS